MADDRLQDKGALIRDGRRVSREFEWTNGTSRRAISVEVDDSSVELIERGDVDPVRFALPWVTWRGLVVAMNDWAARRDDWAARDVTASGGSWSHTPTHKHLWFTMPGKGSKRREFLTLRWDGVAGDRAWLAGAPRTLATPREIAPGVLVRAERVATAPPEDAQDVQLGADYSLSEGWRLRALRAEATLFEPLVGRGPANVAHLFAPGEERFVAAVAALEGLRLQGRLD